MLNITEQAQEKFLEVIRAQGRDDLAVYFRILGRGVDAFAYDIKLVVDNSLPEDDLIVESGDLTVRVEAASAAQMDGATVDFNMEQHGFTVENPNPVWEDETGREVARVIMEQINPSVGQHGGAILPVEVKDGIVKVRMLGGCQGCGMASVTLTQGVTEAIQAAVPGIREVVDITHHAGGTNPYYK